MAEALKISYNRMDVNNKIIDQYKHELKFELAKIDNVRFNDDPNNPYILSISFKDVNAESLLYLLSLKHIYVSSGSACNSKDQKVSPILEAIDVPDEYKYGTIRLSFSDENCVDEIPVIVNAIKDCVASIRHSRGVKDIG
jgi:cysteine desulfurase